MQMILPGLLLMIHQHFGAFCDRVTGDLMIWEVPKYTLPEINSSPLKSYRNPISERIAWETSIFQGETVHSHLNFRGVYQNNSTRSQYIGCFFAKSMVFSSFTMFNLNQPDGFFSPLTKVMFRSQSWN